MTQDQIKQAIEEARANKELCDNNHGPGQGDWCDSHCTYSKALILRDAQLAIALEALDALQDMCPHDEGGSGELCECSTDMFIRASIASKAIKQMETR